MTTTAPRPMPYKRYPGENDRTAYAAGLRHLADLVETGQAPIPNGPMNLFIAFGDTPAGEQPTAARNLMRSLGGGKYGKETSGGTMSLEGMCGGVPVTIYVERDAVCERVVIGTEQVEVPARPAIEAHTETREVVEWRCAPLLAAVETADAVVVPA